MSLKTELGHIRRRLRLKNASSNRSLNKLATTSEDLLPLFHMNSNTLQEIAHVDCHIGTESKRMGHNQNGRSQPSSFREVDSKAELLQRSGTSSTASLSESCEIPKCQRIVLWTQVAGMMAGNLFHFSGGYAMGFTSPTLEQLREAFNISTDTSSWVASTLMIGYIIGCCLGGPISDVIGRRRSLQIYSLMSILGWMVVTCAQSETMLLSGRFIHGLADSLAVAPAILFVSEVSHIQYRGLFMTFATICASLGVPVVYIVGSFIPWRFTALIGVLSPLTISALLVFSKETPVFLIKKGLVDQAWNSLIWYRGTDYDVENELSEIQAENEVSYQEFVETERSIFVLVERDTIKPACIAIGLMGLLPMSGVFNITFFAADIITSLGFGTNQTAISVMIGLLRTIGSIISTVTIQKYGRRRNLLISSFLVIVSMGVAALGVFCKEGVDLSNMPHVELTVNCIIVLGLFAFMFTIGLGMNPVPWILLGEWFTPKNRAFINSCGTAFFFFTCFVTIQLSELIQEHLGMAGVLFSFCFWCIIFTLIGIRWVPETQGGTYHSPLTSRGDEDDETSTI
eukprot:maker-scaffold708_size108518-snap-gene-0.15 protein:Tk11257 transcript:maker-scaffold708_size108518-snap-gene-0.15-mRNA-1 annotation:"facilitated trehalose transporter tret1"